MTKQITPLRQRMLDDMALRNMSPATQRLYINAVKNFSVFFGRSPDKLTFADVRTYQLHLVSRGSGASLTPRTLSEIAFSTMASPHGPCCRAAKASTWSFR